MKLIKRKATLLLTTAAALVSLFWITALTAEDIAQTAPTEALNAPAIAATPANISKASTIMDTAGINVNQTTKI